MKFSLVVLILALSYILLSCVTYNGIPAHISTVNKKVNTILTYKSDANNADYWQTPKESMTRRTGDCEDYAILKASMINSAEHIWELLLVETEDGIQHMVLIVDNTYVLDNNYEEVYLITQMKHDVLLRLPPYSTRRPFAFTPTGEAVYE